MLLEARAARPYPVRIKGRTPAAWPAEAPEARTGRGSDHAPLSAATDGTKTAARLRGRAESLAFRTRA